MDKGTFGRINPMFRGETVLTPAEFALFFEGADLEKRFIDSPREKRFPTSHELSAVQVDKFARIESDAIVKR
jgi:hypothetical protein